MNVGIELPSDLETELSAEASQLKSPLSEYILRILSVLVSKSMISDFLLPRTPT